MPFWPDALIKDLISKRVFIVLGAGVSKNALAADGVTRPPTWKELLEKAVARCGSAGTKHIRGAIRNNDLLHACEWLQAKMDEDWIDFLRQELVTPKFQATDIHDAIFRLDQRVTLTPNFDDIYERYVRNVTNGQVIVKNFYEEDAYTFLRSLDMHIIKIHGNMDNPNNLIFTRREYAEARNKYHQFYFSLDAGFLSNTVLFIGCGIEDPDIALLLENQAFRFPDSRPHYMLTPSTINSDLELSLRRARNLKCLKYSPREDHAELAERIRELPFLIEERRQT